MGLESYTPVFITASKTVASPTNRFFRAITATKDSVVSVKGGISAGLAANDSDASTHLTADGSDTLGASHDAGIFPLLPTVAQAITLPAGTTIYGKFTEIATTSDDEVIAYL